jgi:hypothetical protein
MRGAFRMQFDRDPPGLHPHERAVSTPVPAPMSMTNSPGRMPASATIVSAQLSVSRCQPHATAGAGTEARVIMIATTENPANA